MKLDQGMNLPQTSKLLLKYISPRKLHVEWTLSQIESLLVSKYFDSELEELVKVLRIYDVTGVIFNGCNHNKMYEMAISDHEKSKVIKGINPEKVYVAEVGVNLRSNRYFPFIRSNTTFEVDKLIGALKSDEKYTEPIWSDHVSTYSYYENLSTGGMNHNGKDKS